MTTTYIPRPPTIAADAAPASAGARAPARARWYARERWLVVMLAAFVPMAIALSLPPELRAPLVGASLATAAAGLVMLARRPGGSTAGDRHADPLPNPSDTAGWP